MQWLVLLFKQDSVAHAVLVLSLVAGIGLAIGSLKIRGVGLGVAGVLFSGLVFGHFKFHINHEVMEFIREFGLILFVYTIGIQVGPGFIGSLQRDGLPLNLMAAAIVLLGVGMTLTVYFTQMDRKDFPVAVGLFSGASTNTPSLAASQQAIDQLKSMSDPAEREKALKRPGLGYAVAYPFGIIGILLTMLLVRTTCKIDVKKEGEMLAAMDAKAAERLRTMNIEITNPNLNGLPLKEIPTLGQSGVVISRWMHQGKVGIAKGDTVVHTGDVLLAVGPREGLDDFRLVAGVESKVDVRSAPGALTSRRILVTKPAVLGKSIRELDPLARFGVTVTRISRAEVELPVKHDTHLQFGDSLVVVGEPEDIKEMAIEFGDSVKHLNHPQIIPLFLGVALGVIVGSWPVNIPGVPAPVKLGLAGGPLLVAIILSRIGNIGSLVWYMPSSANMMVREIGIALFLACVGLKSGDQFLATLKGPGLTWMMYGAAITFVPLVIVAFFARLVLKLNFMPLCGMLAGSMTDPPALAFAGTMTHSDAPSVSYATVYPLTMLMRVVAGQAMVLLVMS